MCIVIIICDEVWKKWNWSGILTHTHTVLKSGLKLSVKWSSAQINFISLKSENGKKILRLFSSGENDSIQFKSLSILC
jgi:hypothetical protein